MISHFSPTFWVAVSFVLFVLIAWRFIRKTFLNLISAYRNDISSKINDLYNQKNDSQSMLEQSLKKLSESTSNTYILNAHKMAKSISVSSQEKIHALQNNVGKESNYLVDAFEHLFFMQMKKDISHSVAKLVEVYCSKNPAKFNQTINKNLSEAFK